MPSLKDLVPDVETLVGLDPEELGLILLRVLDDPQNQQNGLIHPGNFELRQFPQSGGGPFSGGREAEAVEAVREALAWLEGQALLIPAEPLNAHHGWRRIGRRGRRLLVEGGKEHYQAGLLLPRAILHPAIKDNVYFNFQRGDYPTAVICAFREVELVVAKLSGITGMNGTSLMREAFKPVDPRKKDDEQVVGPLTDTSSDFAEQQARAHLFAGAFGYCRNPHSHKDVRLTAEDAVHMLVLASYLLRIVDDAAIKAMGG